MREKVRGSTRVSFLATHRSPGRSHLLRVTGITYPQDQTLVPSFAGIMSVSAREYKAASGVEDTIPPQRKSPAGAATRSCVPRRY